MAISLDFKTRGNKIGDGHFGANYLANRQTFDQTIENGGLYPLAAASLGVGALRYPGGTLAEQFFDLSDPRHFSNYDGAPIEAVNFFDPTDVTPFTTLGNFLQYADSIQEGVTVVLPTIRYFDALSSGDLAQVSAVESEIKAFIDAALESTYGRWIEAFEIGNEFPSWIAGHNFSLLDDSRDFAMITRSFAVWIDEAIRSAAVPYEPKILAQAAFVLYGERGNNVLLDALFDPDLNAEYAYVEGLIDAYQAIDGVTVHSYPLTPWTADAYGQINLDRDIELFKRWQLAFDEFALQANLPERNLSWFVTEWNVRNSALNNGIVEGLQVATGTLVSFYFLVSSGVDTMHAWPVLQNTTNALIETTHDELSANFNGAALAILRANVVGMRAHVGEMRYDINNDGQSDIVAQLYTSEKQAMIVVASISDTVLEFDLNLPLEHFDFLAANWTSFSLGSSSGDATDVFSQPIINTSAGVSGYNSILGSMSFELSAWSVSVSVFDISSPSEQINLSFNDDQTAQLSFSLYDALSEFEASLLSPFQAEFVHLEASSEDDVVEAVPGFVVDAGAGDDTMHGSSLDDFLMGGAGNDIVFGGTGNDILLFESQDGADSSQGFSDRIYAGEGNDTVSAGGVLFGDFVDAGEGNDVIYFNNAPSLLIGGAGNDTFIFRGGAVFAENTYAWNVSSPEQIGTGFLIPVAGMTQNTSLIDGGEGYDTLYLTSEDDAFFLVDENSAFFEEDGLAYSGIERMVSIEEIHAGDGNDIVDLTCLDAANGAMDFQVFGEAGNDTLWGAAGDDYLDGGDGDDQLFGGAGQDTLVGGAGADLFIFTGSSGQTVIEDFSPADGDHVRFNSGGGFVFDHSTQHITSTEISIDYTYLFQSTETMTIYLLDGGF